MKRKLSEPDRQAVDLILDRFAAAGREDGVQAAIATPAEPHVQSVEKILQALAAMPAEEPPADLLSKTLQKIEQSPLPAEQQMPFVDPGQLHA